MRAIGSPTPAPELLRLDEHVVSPAMADQLREHLQRYPGYLISTEPAIAGPYRRPAALTHLGSFLLGLVVGAALVAGALSLGMRLLPFMPF